MSTTDPAKNTKRKRTEELFTKNEEGKYVFEEPKVEKPLKKKARLVTDEMLGLEKKKIRKKKKRKKKH